MTLTTKSQEILEKIHQRGYWRVVIRPTEFKRDRLSSLKECEETLKASVVNFRLEEYPYVTDAHINKENDWIEAVIDFESSYPEFWRFFQSGQFVHHLGCREDYSPTFQYWPSEATKPLLLISNTLFTTTEIFQFAARLAHHDVLLPGAEISIKLLVAKDRVLVSQELVFLGIHRSASDVIEFTKIVSTQELLARARELALEAAEGIFERFNYSPPRHLLAQDQQRLLQRNL